MTATRCRYCGRRFIPAGPTQRYCSAGCRDSAWNRRQRGLPEAKPDRPEIVWETCAHCGEEYPAYSPRAVYCSDVCRNHVWRARRRGWVCSHDQKGSSVNHTSPSN